MELIKKIIGIVFLMVFIFNIPSVFAEERFQWILSTDTTTYSFDTKTIKFGEGITGGINTSIIDAWLKIEVNEQGVVEAIQTLKNHNLPTEGYENYSYSMTRIQLNLRTNSYKEIISIDYGNRGEILLTHNLNTSWKPVIPDTRIERALDVIKEYVSKNKDIIYDRSKN